MFGPGSLLTNGIFAIAIGGVAQGSQPCPEKPEIVIDMIDEAGISQAVLESA
jgi:hypothetical protein